MKRPEIHPILPIEVPVAKISVAPNGVKILAVENTAEPVVRFSFVFRAGSIFQRVPFSASAAANLLSEGTAHHSAHEIAEMLDFLGSNFEVSMDRDWAVLNFVSLSRHFDRTLEIAREILLEPAFSQEEVRIYCAKRKQRLALERSRPAMRARELFGEALFGKKHPYGIIHDEVLYDTLTREDIVDFWRTHYVSENCFVATSGNVSPRETEALGAVVAALPSGSPAVASLANPVGKSRVFSPQKDGVQSAIRMGKLLFPRTHPDFIGMQVLTTVLGGYFGSRLVRNLREERGYTYGVFSTMVTLQDAGYLAIATEVAATVTDDAIAQIRHEAERLRTELVPEEELEMVKNIMTGEVMRILDGPFGICDVTIENTQNGGDNSYNTLWQREVRATTSEHLLSLARKYLDPAELTVVAVGPEA